MKSRYVVIEYVTGKYHPYMPNKCLFAFKDLKTNKRSLSAYVTLERAKEIVDKKNSKNN